MLIEVLLKSPLVSVNIFLSNNSTFGRVVASMSTANSKITLFSNDCVNCESNSLVVCPVVDR